MDTKGANPFLIMGGDEFPSPPANSNPFLMDNTEFSGGAPFSDNPFLSNVPAPDESMSNAAPANNATNPFAFNPMDFGSAEPTMDFGSAEPTMDFGSAEPTMDFGPSEPLQEPINFAPPEVPIETEQIAEPNDLFGGDIIEHSEPLVQNTPQQQNDFFQVNETNNFNNIIDFDVGIQKPDVLELKHTHTVTRIEDTTNLYSSEEELAKAPPKRPPPPPRPVVPPSKETQDLLMSVMGAMDATSSHLLDRIPPTRTPSPVSMRDLHSPSPTPDNAFADFLDVGTTKAQPTTTNADVNFFDVNDSNDPEPVQVQEEIKPVQNTQDPFMGLMMNNPVVDINQNHSVKTAPARPQRPQPPRPLPPQKPPPPSTRPAPPAIPPQPAMHQRQAPPQIPPQPVIAPQPAPVPASDDMMDMLGETDLPTPVDKPIEKPVASTADIMSLFSSPPVVAKPEPVVDLLSETTETVTTTVVQDNFISPEQSSQHDLHMDTSDTQSKGSGSSVTFNPFASEETVVAAMIDTTSPIQNDNFTQESPFNDQPEINNINITTTTTTTSITTTANTNIQNDAFFDKPKDAFDDFAAKFESAAKDETKNGFDPFGGNNNSAWGNVEEDKGFSSGFDADEPFDAFLSLQEPPAVPQHTPSMLSKRESQESDEDKDFSVVIKPKNEGDFFGSGDTTMPVLAPPPKSPVQNSAYNDNSPRFNPFDQQTGFANAAVDQTGVLPDIPQFQRTDSQETPPTPLFDDDVSQPLEDYPRINWAEEGWEMQLRQPNKKKITGQRFWKKIFVKLIMHEDCPILQLFNTPTDKDAFQELPLQPCYSVSDIGAQQYDNYGKIFTVKLQYIFYKERPGVRPGQVTKAERITNKLSQFAAYAIQGDYQGVKEFGSDLKKLGLPVEHAPQVSQLLKIGSLNYEDMKQFSVTIEEALFHLSAHRDRALHYKMEEVQITAVDELYVEQNAEGIVEKQIARVRLFFLGFLSGMPDIELGVNDMRRQGKEVVGRHDIIPVVTEEWIRLEAVEFHSCVQQDEYHNTHIIKFKPPDACYIELMRFRIRPPKNRELPLQLKPVICVTGNKVEIRADILVPGFASRKLGQVPCEDVSVRIPIPECWIYLFRVEKHFRYGSVKSAHRRTGKIKGIERFLGTVETLQESLIEVTSGQAKYEHQHRAIVWRIPRLPKEGQGAYTTHNLVCKMALTSYDQVPEQLAEYCYVEFTMPATQASHTTVRSVSFQNSQNDDPPEKYVRYLARHEYRVGIEHTEGVDPNPYAAATAVSRTPAPAPVPEEPVTPVAPDPESSSDSD